MPTSPLARRSAKSARPQALAADPAAPVMQRAYARWAPVYDALCGPVFLKGRQAAAAAANAAGRRILEVGVGTGLSFDDYAPGKEIVGIDASAPMVAKALDRLQGGAFPQVRELRVMDAHELGFPDARFDAAVAQFVITLVANPERVLDECARVVAPGGEIILVNHFYSERGVGAAVERMLAQPARRLGLRPDFPFARLEAWAAKHGGVRLIERRPVALGAFSLVRFGRL
jgi:phosphatidylethanolamine/phosphatidyl-N-methylethanolamine N-methyltransferase